MNNFWNERYKNKEFAYGEAPNNFVKQELAKLTPGKILFPAEGEGRNAVYAAKQGWDVTAFDPSLEGKKKAKLLAAKHNVEIEYVIDGYETIDFPKEKFECIVLVFAHMPLKQRQKYHQKLITFLRPGGTLILEGFSKKQINNNTGGPQNIEMLFSEDELILDFDMFSNLKITEIDVVLNEGQFHQGKSSVIRITGIK